MQMQRPRRTPLLATLILGASALALGAQAGWAQDGVTVLDEITLYAPGQSDDSETIVATESSVGGLLERPLLDTPASVSVVTAQELQRRGAQTIEEALQYSAGVVADFYGSDDRFDYFRIRGFDAYAYRDGLPLGRPFGGIREDAFAYDRIEVARGANSSAGGLADPGGSVNYVTKLPKDHRFGQVYATAGSFNRAETGFDFGDNLTPDATLSWRLTGRIKDADAEYDHSRDDERLLMGGLTWRPSEATSLSVVADRLDRDGVPGGGGHPIGSDFPRERFFGEPDYNFRGTERDTLTVLLDHDFGGGLSTSATLRYSDQTSDFGYAYLSADIPGGSTVAPRNFFGNESASDALSGKAQLQYDTVLSGIASRTVGGIEFARRDSDSDSFFGAAPGIDIANPVYSGRPDDVPLFASTRNEQRSDAVFAEQELTFDDRFIATLGLRHDWLDIDQTDNLTGTATTGDISETTGRAALTWKIDDQVSAYGSYATSVAPAAIGTDPEEGRQVEFGVKYQPAGTSALFSAAIYDLKRTNLARIDPVTQLESTIGEVRAKGLDLEAKAEMVAGFNMTGALSLLDIEIVENGTLGNEGNRPQLLPRQTASLWLTYQPEGRGVLDQMSVSAGARYTGQYFYTDANTTGTGSTVVYDLAADWQLREDTSLEINVSNVFDRKYAANAGFGATFYNPGREASVTLRRSW